MERNLIFSLAFLLLFVIAYWTLRRSFSDAWAFSRVSSTPNNLNDDASAIIKVLPLVKEAQEVIEIYDDGDNFPESMYNDEVFVETVEEQLRDSKVKIKCLFNRDDNLLFTQRLIDHPNVEIYTRFRGADGKTHYKIIDGGLKAYLSIHLDDKERSRSFKEVDCSKVPKRKLGMVSESIFSDLRQDMRNFQKKEPAN